MDGQRDAGGECNALRGLTDGEQAESRARAMYDYAPAEYEEIRLAIDHRDALHEWIRHHIDAMDDPDTTADLPAVRRDLPLLVAELERVDALFRSAKRVDKKGKSKGWVLKRLLTGVRKARLDAIHAQLQEHLERNGCEATTVRILSLRVDRHGELYDRDVYPTERVTRALRDPKVERILRGDGAADRRGPSDAAWQALALLEGLSDESSVRPRGEDASIEAKSFSGLGSILFHLTAELPFQYGRGGAMP
jgi:hypothetical protein